MQHRTIRPIDFIALVSRRPQAGAASDGARVGVVLDGPHLTSEVGGTDDVDAGERQEQDVGCADQSRSDVALNCLDFTGFLHEIVVECQSEASASARGEIRRGCLGGPGQNGFERAALIANIGTIETSTQAVQPGGIDVGRSREVTDEVPGAIACPQVGEVGGEAGEGGVEVLANLAAEHGRLANQFPSMSEEKLERGPSFVALGLDQGEAAHGGAMHRDEIVVVGLIARVGGLAELFGGERMNDAGFEAGGSEGALNRAMVTAGAFDRDQQIFQLMVADSLAELVERGFERRPVVGEESRPHQDVAIEIGEHPFGASLGAIDRDDAKVLGTNFLNARMKSTAGLLHDIDTTGTGALAGGRM